MYFLPQLSSQSGVSLNASYQICQVRFGPRAAPGRARAAAHGAAPLRGQPAGVCGFRITLPNLLPKLTTNKQRCEKPRIVTGRRDFGWERSSRGRFATPADSLAQGRSPYSCTRTTRKFGSSPSLKEQFLSLRCQTPALRFAPFSPLYKSIAELMHPRGLNA